MTLLTQDIGIAAEKAVAHWCSYNTLRPKISRQQLASIQILRLAHDIGVPAVWKYCLISLDRELSLIRLRCILRHAKVSSAFTFTCMWRRLTVYWPTRVPEIPCGCGLECALLGTPAILPNCRMQETSVATTADELASKFTEEPCTEVA